MITFLVRRLLQAVAVLLLVSAMVFGFLWLIPGGPQRAGYSAAGSAAQAYLRWLGQVIQGHLGYSQVQNAPVGSLLAASLPRTLVLMLLATALGAAVAIPAGLVQASRRGKSADRVLRGLSYVGYGMPSFLLGALLVQVLAIRLRLFGAEGPQAPGIGGVLADWRDLTLPVVTLAVLTVAVFARYIRAAGIDSLRQDYVRTARAAGAGERQVLARHVLRNSLIPVITLAGLSIPRIFAGALVVESLFNIQGVGWRLWQAALHHDYPVLLGFILVIGAGAVIGSLAADVGYLLADPRVRRTAR